MLSDKALLKTTCKENWNHRKTEKNGGGGQEHKKDVKRKCKNKTNKEEIEWSFFGAFRFPTPNRMF